MSDKNLSEGNITADPATWPAKNEVVSKSDEISELKSKLSEAWKLVNAMAGQEPWERAEQWLEENKEYAPEGAQRL